VFDEYEGLIFDGDFMWDLIEFLGEFLGRGIISW
jgi:hypothetical protein